MPTKASIFADLMQQGTEVLNTSPRSGDAITIYDEAIRTTRKKASKAEAHQMRSIALSLAGKHEESILAADEARKQAVGNDLLLGRIIRDANMARLRYALSLRLSDKRRAPLIALATIGFFESTQVLSKDPEHQFEKFVSIGFTGRAYFATGRLSEATSEMYRCDHYMQLGDNRTYELNNLMWLIRAVDRPARPLLRDRIVKLIEQTGQTSRTAELRLIMIGGDKLYSFVRNRPWIITLTGKVSAR